MVETQGQTIWLDEDGIIRSIAKANAEITLEEAEETVEKIALLCQGIRRPIVVDLTGVKSMSRDARKHFARSDAGTVAALIVRSPLAKAIGNFFMGFDKTAIPSRLFTSEDEALRWARQFVP